MKNKEYSYFLPPDHLAEKPIKKWNKKEAEEYFKWIIESLEERTANLLEFIQIIITEDKIEEHLVQAGKRVTMLLKNYPFSENGTLTNRGYALAADMGLLTAKLLLNSVSSINWSIVKKPKLDISYNQPVLVGFGLIRLDPINGSIAEAMGILKGRRDCNAWKNIYTFWLNKAKEQEKMLTLIRPPAVKSKEGP